MSINTLFKADPTSADSNSNYAGVNIAESCAPSGINNALRALGQMAAQQICYQGPAISASVSTNIAADTSGLFNPIVGANAINSFGVVPGEQPGAAVVRFLEFSSSASLSHGTGLRLLGAASRKTQPGDIGGYFHVGTGSVWHEFLYSRADGSGLATSESLTTLFVGSMSASVGRFSHLAAQSSSVSAGTYTSISASVGAFGILKYAGAQLSEVYVQVKSASTAASNSTSSNIPFDTSIPQNDEGENIFSLSITPKNAASILEIEGLIFVSHLSSAIEVTATLFLDNGANAIAASSEEVTANNVTPIPIYFEHTASTTTEHVYALRYGATTSSAKLNHGSSGNLGGTLRSWLRVRERL